jgi:hypothetical protein
LMTSRAQSRSALRWRLGRLVNPRSARVALVVVLVGALLAVPLDRATVVAAGPAPGVSVARQVADAGRSATFQRLLVEHVYLTGMLVTTILDGRQEQLQATIDAVDANSRALADQVGQAHGPEVREALLTAWRGQVGLFIDYAFGAATGDDAKKGIALANLNDARGNIDAAVTGGDSGLDPGTVAELLRPQVGLIVGAVDAFAAGDTPGGYASLQRAAAGVPALADALAGSIATAAPAPVPASSAPAPTAPMPAPSASAPSATPSSGPPPATVVTAPQSQAVPAPQPALSCTVAGPATRYVTTMNDFGLGGGSILKQYDAGYWGGQGTLIGFERSDGDAFQGSPWGGYVIAGVVVGADEREAASGLNGAVDGWTADWHPYDATSLAGLGDEARVVVRLTPWEIAASQPMAEVFLVARQCNALVHVLLAVMPEYGPVTQAERYARLMLDRM